MASWLTSWIPLSFTLGGGGSNSGEADPNASGKPAEAIKDRDEITSISFNVQNTLFSVGTTKSFLEINTKDFKTYCQEIFPNGVKEVIQIDDTECFFVVLLEDRLPQWDKRYVYLFNISKKVATNKFRIPECGPTSPVSVKGNIRNVFISAGNKLFIYSVEKINSEPIWSTEIFNGDSQILDISHKFGPVKTFFVFPSVEQGKLSLASITHSDDSYGYDNDDVDDDVDDDVNDGDDSEKVKVFKKIFAHNGQLECTALSNDGSLVATASDKGTIIRVYVTSESCDRPLKEFRRGHTQAVIKDIKFSPDNRVLAVVSGNGTCHLFGLDPGIANRVGYYGFGYDWSSLDIPCSAKELRVYKIAFLGNEKIVVADSAGKALVADLVYSKGKEMTTSKIEIVDYFN